MLIAALVRARSLCPLISRPPPYSHPIPRRTRSLDENSVGGGLEEAAVASAPALGPRLLSSFSSRTSPRVLRPLDEPN